MIPANKKIVKQSFSQRGLALEKADKMIFELFGGHNFLADKEF